MKKTSPEGSIRDLSDRSCIQCRRVTSQGQMYAWHMVFWWMGACVWFQDPMRSTGALVWELISFPSDLLGKGVQYLVCFGRATGQESIFRKYMENAREWRWPGLLLESCHFQHGGLSSQVSVEAVPSHINCQMFGELHAAEQEIIQIPSTQQAQGKSCCKICTQPQGTGLDLLERVFLRFFLQNLNSTTF